MPCPMRKECRQVLRLAIPGCTWASLADRARRSRFCPEARRNCASAVPRMSRSTLHQLSVTVGPVSVRCNVNTAYSNFIAEQTNSSDVVITSDVMEKWSEFHRCTRDVGKGVTRGPSLECRTIRGCAP